MAGIISGAQMSGVPNSINPSFGIQPGGTQSPTAIDTSLTPTPSNQAFQTTAPTPVTPAQATASSTTPTLATAASMTPTTSHASTYDPTKLGTATSWNVSPDQTVQGQLNNILSANSPIIQSARAGAIQTANDRGLANSSLAATGGELAAINSATPIATSDATTLAKAAGYNADESNQFAINNANISNTAAGFNAQQLQQSSQANANAQNNAAQLNANNQQQVSLTNAAASNDASKFNATQAQDVSKSNAAATNTVNQFNASQELQGAQYNVGQANATQLANIESNYKQLMQSSASASDLYKTTVDSIKQIQLSTDLDASAKQAAVDQQLKLLQTGMSITGAISNLNLGSLVTFDNSTNSPTLGTPSVPVDFPFYGNFGGY